MKTPKTFTAFLWHFVKQQRIGFFILMFTAVVWAINEVCFPYFLKLITNAIVDYAGEPKQIFIALRFPLLALTLFWAAMELAMRWQGISTIYIFPRFRANIRREVYDYIKQHSHEYFANNFAGNIAKKMADLPASCQTVIEIICFNFTSIIVALIFTFVLMSLTKPIFAGIFLAWVILHFSISIFFLRKGNEYWEQHADAVADLNGKLVDSITNILNVRLFARAQYESEYISIFQAEEISKAKKAMWHMEWMRILQGLAAFLLIISMVGLLVTGWSQGWVTVGDFTLIGMLTFGMLGMVWFMSYQLMMLVREVGTINEALTLITKGHDIVDMPHALPLKVTHGAIQFRHVTFSYQKHHHIFEDLNVTIPAGQKVGLVGFSGSGKTTFVNLILRAYDIDGGHITIDGQDIAKVQQNSLREHIAMIPQDPSLFHRSLLDNIRYGRLDATDEEVIAASKLAHCHDFVEKLTEGYQSLVGERGVKLSGGQRQRIAIARAILKNAPILILDEATSSLDSVTEKLIQESLQHLMQNRTTIVVAHRLSTLADMDRILVFHKGRIIEDGNKESLLQSNGHFAHLWSMQMEGFLPSKDDGI